MYKNFANQDTSMTTLPPQKAFIRLEDIPMTVKDELQFCASFVSDYFRRFNRVELSKKKYDYEVTSCYLGGECSILEHFTSVHLRTPYQSVEELFRAITDFRAIAQSRKDKIAVPTADNTLRTTKKLTVFYRFPQCDYKKFTKDILMRDYPLSYIMGQISMVDELVKRNEENPYNSVSEVMGDLQILFRDKWNAFHKLNPTKTERVDINHVMNLADEFGNKLC